MAEFHIKLVAPGTYYPSHNLFFVGNRIASDYIATGDFSAGNTIIINMNGSETPWEYIGYYENGWIGSYLGGVSQVRYFSGSDDPSTIPDDFLYSTEPFTVCFLAGTRVATPGGDVAVETLSIGNPVLTHDGRVLPVRWIGRQSVVTVFADEMRTMPVRIAAGALGDNLPAHDLLVSPDHALMLSGALVQAGALVNGTTIVRETAMPERFTYFHVELADHALILAEGVPAETFVDNVTRRRFDNYAEYEALYGETVPAIPELVLPRIKSARQLPPVLRDRLAARSAVPGATATVAAA